MESGSFIEEDLRAYFADELYSLKTTKGDGYVYCLIEHQSSPDRHIAVRMLRYAVAAMQRHLDAGHQELPLVTLLNWMLQTRDIAEPRAFLEKRARRSPDYEETFMTAAQKLIQEGLEKACSWGARLERRDAKRRLKILKNGHDRATDLKMTDLSEDGLTDLDH